MITLYHTSHCPNCLAQEKILNQLKSQIQGFEFTSINLETEVNLDIKPPIQSVPTLFINHYRFEGLLKANQIESWLGTDNHDAQYINELLSTGQLQQCFTWLQQHPHALPVIAELLTDDSLTMGVRVGLDVIIEQLAECGALHDLSHILGQLLSNVDDSLCIDILHYLSMIGDDDAYTFVEKYSHHTHPEVKRIAKELLSERHTTD